MPKKDDNAVKTQDSETRADLHRSSFTCLFLKIRRICWKNLELVWLELDHKIYSFFNCVGNFQIKNKTRKDYLCRSAHMFECYIFMSLKLGFLFLEVNWGVLTYLYIRLFLFRISKYKRIVPGSLTRWLESYMM